MEALDLLEKRIDSLSRVLGPIPDDDIRGSENFVDSLLSADTLISSAIAGRDNICQTLQRTEELDRYLDPNYLEEIQQIKAKEVYVNAVSPELAVSFSQLAKVKELESTLGAEYFINIPSDIGKLKEIMKNNSEYKEQVELIDESLIVAMKTYGKIQAGLVESLAGLNKRLDILQERLEKRRDLDVE